MSSRENGPISPPFAFDAESDDLAGDLAEVLAGHQPGARVANLLLRRVVRGDVDAGVAAATLGHRHVDLNLAQA